MKKKDFFLEKEPHSEIKTNIVIDYFREWSSFGMGSDKEAPTIAYYEFYCGPGRYQDGTPGTAISLLEIAVTCPDLQKRLTTSFVDSCHEHIEALKSHIESLEDITLLDHVPKTLPVEINEEFAEEWAKGGSVPALYFVDPYGYKGLSEYLIYVIVKDWACDCIFFFSYNAINRFIAAPNVYPHMRDLFGEKKIEFLLKEIPKLPSPEERENAIIEELKLAMRDNYVTGCLPFRFRRADSYRTSHYLIFVTKDEDSLERMKHVMARHSNGPKDQAPCYEFDPKIG